MSRFYLRLFFKYFDKILSLIKKSGKIHYELLKTAVYRDKVKKVLKKNKNRLSRNLEIIDIANQYQAAKIINKIR